MDFFRSKMAQNLMNPHFSDFRNSRFSSQRQGASVARRSMGRSCLLEVVEPMVGIDHGGEWRWAVDGEVEFWDL